MSFPNILFTSAGYVLQAKAQMGTPLIFTRIAMGDGSLTGQVQQELNVLIDEKKSISLTRFKDEGNGIASIGGALNNQDIEQGFWWREIGLFAQDPDDEGGEILYCYGNASELAEYIPAGGESEIIEKQISISAIIGNATDVSAVINNSLIFVMKNEFDTHIEEYNQIIEQVRNTTQQVDALAQDKADKTTTTDLANQIDVLSTDKADKNNAAFTGTMTLDGQQIATTDKAEILLSSILLSDYIAQSSRFNKVTKNSLDNIEIEFSISKSDSGNFATGIYLQLFTLPVGYKRSYVYTNVSCYSDVAGSLTSYIGDAVGYINSSGEFQVHIKHANTKHIKVLKNYYL